MKSNPPLDMVPDDIGYEILRIAYAHSTFPYCEYDWHPRWYLHSPLPISHVSRRWRDLAISLPSLWQCIHFVHFASGGKGYSDIVKTYLARSGQLPLSIQFDCQRSQDTDSDSSESHSDSEEPRRCPCFVVWDMLLKERARWRHCVIDAQAGTLLTSLTQQMCGEAFPRLEYLQIPCSGSPHHAQSLRIAAPNLTQLRASGFQHDGTILHSTPLQLFSKLTTLEMDFFYYDTEDHVERFIAMLEGVSATIQVLILSHACINVEVPSTSLDLMPAVFPCLRFLVVESWLEIGDTDSEQSVIASLCRAACAVDRLHIIGRYCARVHSFLHAGALQFPAVRFLRYCIVDEGPSADWLTFIAAFPLLEELQISGGNPAPVLHAAMAMDAAAAAGEGVPAWRNLKTLIFLGAHEYIAVRFVQHRARTGHPLAAVTYAGWFGAHAKQVFKTLNVNYTPLRRSMADGHDSTKDWIEYWRMVNGELEFLSLPVSSDSSVPIEIC